MKTQSDANPRLVRLALGAARGEPIDLTFEANGEFVFGRDGACDVPIKDRSVSRRHCRIIRRANNFHLQDLGSRNGTFVNDAPVKKRRLGAGDRIRVGDANFVFLAGEAGDEAATVVSEARFDDGTLVTNSAIRLTAGASRLPPDLSVLVKLGKAVGETKESDALQRKILETILDFIPARRAAILLTNEDLSELQAVCVAPDGEQPMRVSRTVSGQVLKDQAALLSSDLKDDELDKAESLIASRVASVLCVPMKIGGGRDGLIYLDTTDAGAPLTETHLEQTIAVSYLVAAALEHLAAIENLRQENETLKSDLLIETSMLGESAEMCEVFKFIERAAPTDSTVLITGESGTGKELVAQAIHRNSPRRAAPFAAISCAALNENLLESELFGYEKGAFTGASGQKKGRLESADGGTIFLDEIGEISPAVQAKLLRVLQEREFERVGGTTPVKVNVRVIAATNRDLEAEAASGRFRSDLFFRLNVVRIKTPPLRERKSDIPLLARHFVRKYSERCRRRVVGISKRAEKILLRNDWRGNVRELENAIERAVVMGGGDKINPEDLPREIVENAAPRTDESGDYNEQLKRAKCRIVESAIEYCQGNLTAAARRLGIHPNNLHRLMRELGMK